MACPVSLLPVLHRFFLRFLRLLLRLPLLFHALPVSLLRALLRRALRGIRAGMDNGRNGKRQTEKDKENKSCNFLHRLSTKQALCGILHRELLDEETFPPASGDRKYSHGATHKLNCIPQAAGHSRGPPANAAFCVGWGDNRGPRPTLLFVLAGVKKGPAYSAYLPASIVLVATCSCRPITLAGSCFASRRKIAIAVRSISPSATSARTFRAAASMRGIAPEK